MKNKTNQYMAKADIDIEKELWDTASYELKVWMNKLSRRMTSLKDEFEKVD